LQYDPDGRALMSNPSKTCDSRTPTQIHGAKISIANDSSRTMGVVLHRKVEEEAVALMPLKSLPRQKGFSTGRKCQVSP
jgi:hypothetical protein